jgi:hypothetical protein
MENVLAIIIGGFLLKARLIKRFVTGHSWLFSVGNVNVHGNLTGLVNVPEIGFTFVFVKSGSF